MTDYFLSPCSKVSPSRCMETLIRRHKELTFNLESSFVFHKPLCVGSVLNSFSDLHAFDFCLYPFNGRVFNLLRIEMIESIHFGYELLDPISTIEKEFYPIILCHAISIRVKSLKPSILGPSFRNKIMRLSYASV